MCKLVIPQYRALCSLHFDLLISFTLWYSSYDLFEKPRAMIVYIYSSLLYYLLYVYWTLSTHWAVEVTFSLFILFRLIACSHVTFVGPSEPTFVVVICTFLCLVNTPQLRICIKIIKLYYEVNLLLLLRWTLIELFKG